MTRTYKQKRRAEQTAETRRRIVEATVALHGTIGPARTTFSKVAEAAGIQRHTLYAHFPDERSLLLACSGHHIEGAPPPDPASWGSIAGRRERLATALSAIYAWYEENAELIACVIRDAEHHPPTREITAMRFGPHFAAWEDALGREDATAGERAMLGLALSFHTWRTLARDRGLGSAKAAKAMTDAVVAAGG